MKSPELLRKHCGFMSPIAHGSSLIHSANSSVQNRWSNTKKRTIATSSEEIAKKWQNELFDHEVTWTFENASWIHVACRLWMLPDPFSKLWRPKLVEQHPKNIGHCFFFLPMLQSATSKTSQSETWATFHATPPMTQTDSASLFWSFQSFKMMFGSDLWSICLHFWDVLSAELIGCIVWLHCLLC